MNRTEMIVTMIASLGWLFLAARAFKSRGQSFERTALMAVCWILLFAIVAVVAAKIGA
jgi:hypothetical protein